jgi:NADPH:quinone reductase-like Zn-dependent oxidoreductase
MTETIQKTMRATAINRFGGIEEIKLQMLPVPEIEPDEVLIRIESAGVDDVELSQEVIANLNRLIEASPFEVHIARTFPLDRAARGPPRARRPLPW